jgi:hypothetical protein
MKRKEAVIVKLTFNTADLVILVDWQVFSYRAIHLSHAVILVVQLGTVAQPI